MHLTIKQIYLEKIKSYLQILLGSREAQNNFLLKAKGGKVILLGQYKGEIIRWESEANPALVIRQEGETTIQTKHFYNLIGKLNIKKELEICLLHNHSLQFTAENSYEFNLVLPNENLEDINIAEEVTNRTPIPFPREILLQSYNKLKEFCRKVEGSIVSKPVLSNIHFEKMAESDQIEVWASDTYRFVRGQFFLEGLHEFEINLLPEFIALILELYPYQQSINFYHTGQHLICGREGCMTKIKIDSSPYPSCSELFDFSSSTSFTIEKDILMNSIDRSISITNNHTSYTLFADCLVIEYQDPNTGKCKETLDIKRSGSNTISFRLNNSLLKGIIRNIESDKVVFKLKNQLKPIEIQDISETNPFQQFILPLRTL